MCTHLSRTPRHDQRGTRLITQRQLIATRIALVHTMEARRRNMEKRLDDSEARMIRTRHPLAASAALLQQAKASLGTIGSLIDLCYKSRIQTSPRPWREQEGHADG